MSAPFTVLLVGAGSVGQIYALHLQRGGARVRFLVRPRYVAEVRQGFTLHGFERGGAKTHTLQPDGVFGTPEEACEGGVDAVLLCMSYAGLRGAWLGELLAHAGEATVISLVPGLDARRYLLEHVPEERLGAGIITLLGYPSPLPGQDLPPGTAFWFPPLAPAPFEGPEERIRPLVQALKQGGQPATIARNLASRSAMATGLFMPLIAALEVSGWRFASLATGGGLETATRAGREAQAIIAARDGTTVPLVGRLVRPWMLRLVLAAAPRLVPFDLERFLEVHFTKVGAQTRLFLDDWIRAGADVGRTRTHLEALRVGLEERR